MTPTASSTTIEFDGGLPGFPDAHRFALEPLEAGAAFSTLRCADVPGLKFVVVPPAPFFPDYELEIDDATAEQLDLHDADDAMVYVILTLADDPAQITANLAGPVVVNRHTLKAVQAVQVGSGYDLRAPLLTR